jgi:hypothetical protein
MHEEGQTKWMLALELIISELNVITGVLLCGKYNKLMNSAGQLTLKS